MSFSRKVALKDIATKIYSGGTPSRKKPEYWENGTIPWLKTNQIGEFVIYDTDEHITELGLNSSSAKLVKKNSLVIAMYGDGITRVKVSIIGRDLTTNQACCNLGIDSSKAEFKFIYYLLKQNYSIFRHLSNGGAQQNLNVNMIREFEVEVPSLDEQKSIAHILSTLDEKIETNNQINKKLEEMSQAIFKQWFIDFEFPNEDGEPYKSSGGEMVESEMGMIPKVWEIGTFRDYTDTVLGGDWGKENPQGNYIKEVYCLRGADIPEVRVGKKGALPKRYILENNYNNKKLNHGDLVVEISGGSPTQSTGRISYISNLMLDKYDSDFVCTNFCRAITLKDKYLMEFFYLYWTQLYDLDIFFQYENGTTGIKNFDINTFLDKFLIVKPAKEIINKFHSIIASLLNTIQSNGSENIELSKIRDMLLPKLMSGEIKVSLND